MKRLIMLAVLCAFVLSAAAASAADIKATAEFKTDAVWNHNWNFAKGDNTTDEATTFDINQRLEVTMDFIANENLKAVMTLRAGTSAWGDDLALGGTDTLAVRKAYLDFNWPDTAINVKVGHQGIALPNAVGGSMLLDSRASALLVSAPVSDNVALTGGYIRALDAGMDGQIDLYALIASITAGDMNFTPFFVLGNIGGQANIAGTGLTGLQSTNSTAGKTDGAYWLGLSTTMAFGDINVAGDFNYGAVNAADDNNDRSGWYVGLSADYAMDMMTPEAFFVYTTGEDDDNTNGSERMANLAPDWAVGSFYFGGDAWLNGSVNGGAAPLGFWALGANLKQIASFADGLTHQATIMYAKGTNDKASAPGLYGTALTEEDSLIEIDFNTYYKVYDALTIGVELGYLNLDADKDVWGDDGGSAYKVATGLKYKF
jgi:hypothetical protein